MRQITVKYMGECRKCAAPLEIGTQAMYEKLTGIFCVGCEPTDTEDIRAYRQEGADRKADKLEGWADKRKADAARVLKAGEPYRSDLAFNTQPGPIPFRARLIAREDRAYESLRKADGMQARANSLRHVAVAGDREKKRQIVRDAMKARLTVGAVVDTGIYGLGVVEKINKKTATIGKTGTSGTYKTTVDLSFLRIIGTESKHREAYEASLTAAI